MAGASKPFEDPGQVSFSFKNRIKRQHKQTLAEGQAAGHFHLLGLLEWRCPRPPRPSLVPPLHPPTPYPTHWKVCTVVTPGIMAGLGCSSQNYIRNCPRIKGINATRTTSLVSFLQGEEPDRAGSLLSLLSQLEADMSPSLVAFLQVTEASHALPTEWLHRVSQGFLTAWRHPLKKPENAPAPHTTYSHGCQRSLHLSSQGSHKDYTTLLLTEKGGHSLPHAAGRRSCSYFVMGPRPDIKPQASLRSPAPLH